MKVVAFCGYKGSGKNTAAIPLINAGYKLFSFADTLKDVLAIIFLWPRDLLQGDTAESRLWREQVDPWWAKKLNILDFSPRKALQMVGTDLFRTYFNEEIWVLNLERKLEFFFLDNPEGKAVIDYGRYPNEFALFKKYNAKVYRIQRDTPIWEYTALDYLDLIKFYKICCKNSTFKNATSWLKELKNIIDVNKKILDDKGVHDSEYSWLREDYETIENKGTITELHQKITDIIINPTNSI